MCLTILKSKQIDLQNKLDSAKRLVSLHLKNDTYNELINSVEQVINIGGELDILNKRLNQLDQKWN